MLLMQQDYTRKTQEVAATRRALEAQASALGQAEESARASLEAEVGLVGALHGVQAQLAALAQVDWRQVSAEVAAIADPVQRLDADRLANARWREYQELQQAQAGLAAQLEERQQERALAAQQETARRLEHCNATLARPDPSREWPGFTPQIATRITSSAPALGYSPEELAAVDDARHVQTLYLATLGLELIRKQRAATGSPRPEARPAPQLSGGGGGGGPARGLDDRRSIKDWVAERERQLSSRRKGRR